MCHYIALINSKFYLIQINGPTYAQAYKIQYKYIYMFIGLKAKTHTRGAHRMLYNTQFNYSKIIQFN